VDYLIDFRVRRYLRAHGGSPSLAELSRALQVTTAELVNALERLSAAGQIARPPAPGEAIRSRAAPAPPRP
jgi:DNA-binding MarR family transcriptional regulator